MSEKQFEPYQTRGRFYLDYHDEWCVVDDWTAKLVGFPTKAEAISAATFARAYVKKHGDIDLGSFPFDLDTPLVYEDDPNDTRPWRMIDGVRVASQKDHLPTPICVVNTLLSDMSASYREACMSASDCWIPLPNVEFRIECYATADIVALIESRWRWSTRLDQIDDDQDVERVKKIMGLLSDGADQWPYVSYWANDLESLFEVMKEVDGSLVVLNHGDGWHRIVAANELGRPTIDIAFPLR